MLRLLGLTAAAVGAAGAPASLSVWPLPKTFNGSSSVVALSPQSLRFVAKTPTPELTAAFTRYTQLIFPHVVSPSDAETVWNVVVDVQQTNVPLNFGVDESYTLDINEAGATIKANTVWGALYGIETLSQMVSFDFGSESYYISGAPWHIEDAPRFQHRGLLIDAGRHFESVMQVKAFIDSMVYSKFNVLHWHMTEDESFPMPSHKFPELQRKGAFSAYDQYTWGDVADIIEYARMRGVRVMPEFDMPGHTSSWRNSHPEVFAEGCLTKGSRGAFDPAVEQTFPFIEATLKDWTEGLFPDSFIHLGSDEVPTECWDNNRTKEWMKTKNLTDANAVFNYFLHNVASIANKLGKQVMLWDEAFISAKPPKDVIIQNWHEPELFQQIIAAGYRGIYSSSGSYQHGWYLDALSVTWELMYMNDPMTGINPANAPLVLGGEGCMWGETVDPSDLEFTVWPRAAAIAERLWSPREATTSTQDAEPRLQVFRCKLLERGVHAGFVGSTGRQAPPGAGSCAQGTRWLPSQKLQGKAAQQSTAAPIFA